MEREQLAQQFIQQWHDDTISGYSLEKLTETYQANKDDFDLVSYQRLTIGGAEPEFTDEMTEEEYEALVQEALAAVKAEADAVIETIDDEESFIEAARLYMGAPEDAEADGQTDDGEPGEEPGDDGENEPEPGESGDENVDDDQDANDDEWDFLPPPFDPENFYVRDASRTDNELGDWLFDEARQPGDLHTLEQGFNVVIIRFIERNRQDDRVADVRHILLRFGDDEDEEGNPTEENRAETLAKAEAILDEWKAGAATEDSFAVLALQRTDDTASIPDGGRYQGIRAGSNFVEPFENWSLDPNVSPGDTAIVETDFGYHIMYMVNNDTPFWQIQARELLYEEDFGNWMDGLTEQYPLKANLFPGSLFVKRI
jgi:parvulin-like peptidyl-prolyl isomerase